MPRSRTSKTTRRRIRPKKGASTKAFFSVPHPSRLQIDFVRSGGCRGLRSVHTAALEFATRIPRQTDRLRNNARVQARCPKRSCHRRISWTCNHPLLHLGRQGLSIGQQSAIYLSILLGCSHHAISIHLGVSRFTVNAFASKFKAFISNRVTQTQESITFGTDTDNWDELEVDEVTLGKDTTKAGKIRWSNYVGLIRRGIPESLWISRLQDRTTGALQSSWSGAYTESRLGGDCKGQDQWEGCCSPFRLR